MLYEAGIIIICTPEYVRPHELKELEGLKMVLVSRETVSKPALLKTNTQVQPKKRDGLKKSKYIAVI